MWTFSDILGGKNLYLQICMPPMFPARGSFACGMTFLLLAGAFSGLSLTFAPHPRENAVIYQHSPAAFLPVIIIQGNCSSRRTDLLAWLDFPVKQQRDDVSTVQTTSRQRKHSDGFVSSVQIAQPVATSNTRKNRHTGLILSSITKGVCVCVLKLQVMEMGGKKLLCTFPRITLLRTDVKTQKIKCSKVKCISFKMGMLLVLQNRVCFLSESSSQNILEEKMTTENISNQLTLLSKTDLLDRF